MKNKSIAVICCILSFLGVACAAAVSTPIGTVEPQPCLSDAMQFHFLTDPLRVVGRASSSLEAAQVVINLTAETLEQVASEALQKNSKILNNSIAAFKSLGLEESEFSTQGLQVYPSYSTYLNQTTNSYQTKFEGYKVINNLIVFTKKMALAGKIIDAAVINGVSHINSISYSPLESVVAQQKEKLLAEAVQNARKQAEIIVKQLDYVIKSVKSINLYNNNYAYPRSPSPNVPMAAPAAPAPPTAVFAPSENETVQVEVSFIIAPKA